MSLVRPYKGVSPRIHPSVFLAESSAVIGDVDIGEACSLWYGAVVRGDVMPIRIGARTSIQDNTVVHATLNWTATTIGEDCTVGHSVVLHGCHLADRVLVGMGSIIMDAADIGSDTIVAAGSLITTRATFPPGVLLMGRPAKVARELSNEERASILESAQRYIGYVEHYRTES